MAKSNPLIPRVDIREADVQTGKVIFGFFTGGTSGVIDVEAQYMPACILLDLDTGIGYKNSSTTDTPDFDIIDTQTQGLPALASANVWIGNGSSVATARAITGVIALSNTGVTSFVAGSIVNADINASAAIAFSKLAALTSAQILVGSAGNVATAVAMSGDVTINNTGVTAIGAGKVLLAMLGTGIAPSHVVKFAGKHTTTGGSATEAFTVTGVAATDIVMVTIQTVGGTPRTIVSAAPTTNTITIVFSGDPSTDHIVAYEVLRAAS